MTLPPEQEEDSRYAAVRQYSLAQILAVWAFAPTLLPTLSVTSHSDGLFTEVPRRRSSIFGSSPLSRKKVTGGIW
jgi:hypothetical protein